AAALPVIAARCDEVGRDPATLRVSVHVWGPAGDVRPGVERRQRLRDYASLGLSRTILQGFAAAANPHALDPLVEDCAAAGFLEAAPVTCSDSRAGPGRPPRPPPRPPPRTAGRTRHPPARPVTCPRGVRRSRSARRPALTR